MRIPTEPTSKAFDHIASSYDCAEAANPVLQCMRARVQATALRAFSGGNRILELGGGTGTDALYLAERGFTVVGVEPSAQMRQQAWQKIAAAQLCDRVQCVEGDADHLRELELYGTFDGAFSNFGALNCTRSLAAVANGLARLLRPRARVVLSIMPPVCPWEIGYHVLRGKVTSAFRRVGATPGVLANVEGTLVRTFYYSSEDVKKAFRPAFVLEQSYALGVIVPPPYLQRLASAQPVFSWLCRAEERIAGWAPFNRCGDHLVYQFRKT